MYKQKFEGVMKILAIGAHFDDVELGCGGTIARYANEGHEVIIYVATDSGYTNYAKQVVRQPEIAYEEGMEAATILGVKRVACDSFPTNNLQFNDKLVKSLVRIIEEEKIDMILTHWTGDVHLDHRNLARASLSAGRHVKKILMYRSNYYDSDDFFRGNFYVDITQVVDIKRRAIMAHKSEYERVGRKWLDFFLNQNKNDGQRIEVEYAEQFEVIRFLI